MTKKKICITISDDTWNIAKKNAKKESRSLSSYLSNLVLKDTKSQSNDVILVDDKN